MKEFTGGTDIVAWWEEQRLIYSVNFYTNVIKFQAMCVHPPMLMLFSF